MKAQSSALYKWLVGFSNFKTFLLFLLLFIGSMFVIATAFHPKPEDVPSALRLAGIVQLFTPDETYSAIKGYGQSHRGEMIGSGLFDIFILSVVWSIFFAVTYTWTFRKIFPKNDKYLKWALLIPVVGFFLDEIQNVATMIVFLNYPSRIDWLAASLPYITNVLWTLIYLGFLLIGFGLVGAGFKSFQTKTKK